MVLMVGRCKTSKDDENLFRFMWQLSMELDKEIGIAYCRKRDRTLYPYKLCIGDECAKQNPTVNIEACPSGQKRMDVHTHPRMPIPVQSTGDIMESTQYGVHESCIIDRDGRYACIIGFDKAGHAARTPLYELRHECGKANFDDAQERYRNGNLDYEEYRQVAEPYYHCIMSSISKNTKLKACEGRL